MRVGVIPKLLWRPLLHLCIPHASGGDPIIRHPLNFTSLVFPMRVGVILLVEYLDNCPCSIPHASGGDPSTKAVKRLLKVYSPCEWG